MEKMNIPSHLSGWDNNEPDILEKIKKLYKKNSEIFYIGGAVLLVLLIGLVLSSKNGEISSEGGGTESASLKRYDTYKDALAANDFEAAHQFVEKMKAEEESYEKKKDWESQGITEKNRKTAQAEIYRQEATFLVSLNDENADERLLYLISEIKESDAFEESSYESLIDKLVDLAIKNNKDQLVMDLAKQYNYSMSFYWVQPNAKLLQYLASFKDENHANYIVNILLSQTTISPPLTAGEHDHYEVEDNHYAKWVQGFNNQCNSILDMAIAAQNDLLAKKIINIMKPNVKVAYKTSASYDISYVDDDKDEAQKKYQEAVRSGAFN